MNTVAVPGLSFKVRLATKDDFINLDMRDSILVAVHDYISRAMDFDTSPADTFHALEDSILHDDQNSILILNTDGVLVNGFMHCKLSEKEPNVAIVHQAFAVPGVSKQTIVDGSALFETWAREKNCRIGKFYTFRVPGAHRMYSKLGWEHALTIYKKEL